MLPSLSPGRIISDYLEIGMALFENKVICDIIIFNRNIFENQ